MNILSIVALGIFFSVPFPLLRINYQQLAGKVWCCIWQQMSPDLGCYDAFIFSNHELPQSQPLSERLHLFPITLLYNRFENLISFFPYYVPQRINSTALFTTAEAGFKGWRSRIAKTTQIAKQCVVTTEVHVTTAGGSSHTQGKRMHLNLESLLIKNNNNNNRDITEAKLGLLLHQVIYLYFSNGSNK